MKYHNEWHPGNHRPILSVETFNKVQKLLDDRKEMYAEHKKKTAGYATYLGGFLHCKHCGGKYAFNTWKTRKGTITNLYQCYSRCKKVKKMIKDPNCKNKNWKMEELDNLIFAEIRKLATDPEYINTVKAEKEEQTGDANKIEVIKKEIAKIDEQISRFMDLYGIGQFDIEQVKSKVEPLNKHKQALEAELQSINAVPVALSEKEAVRIAKDFEDVLNRGDLNEVRLLIESLIYYIELDGEDAYIHWKFA
jgi:site-specific DNA recombinase